MKKFSLFLLLALCCAPILSGCGTVVRVATQTVLRKLGSGSSRADSGYIASLTPLDSGKGLVVFEPQTEKSVAQWADLGAGCARYLQVHVAGQGGLGKTPLWGQVDDLRRRFGHANLQLGVEKARQMAAPSGATHVAVGKLVPSGDKITLRYDLFPIGGGKSLAGVQITASPAQLPAQLPRLARQMAAKMGVSNPQIPSRVALSATDLAFLGGQKRKLGFRETLSNGEAVQLQVLSSRDALAGVMAGRLLPVSDEQTQQIADDLLRLSPRNALVVGEVGWRGAHRFMTHTAQLDAAAKSYPRNSLVSLAKMRFERGNRARALEIQWAENAARANSTNALLWVELAWAHFNAARDIRRSRYANQISSAEWRRLRPMYSKMHAAAQKAVEVDPDAAFAWSQLSRAAAFNGDGALSERAVWKSLALDPTDSDAYDWGLEQCQPKWGGNAASVLKMAKFAAANADKVDIDTRPISAAFSQTNQRANLRPILLSIIAKAPQSAGALTEMGTIYHYDDRDYAKAEPFYQRALQLNPKDDRATSSLADLTFFVHNDPKGAESLYRRAIALEPNDGYYHANLARCLASSGRQSEAVAEANRAKALGFHDQNHPVWGATGIRP